MKHYRINSPDIINIRSIEEENGERYLEGYASVFNKLSKPLMENNRLFREKINQNAFDEVLSNPELDVIYNVNHSNGSILGRTKSGTLELSVDDYGLKFRLKVPNTTLGNDIYELVSRGDLYENSFCFITRKDDIQWSKDENGEMIRTVNNIYRLLDVSTVTNGAYADTNVSAREEDKLEDYDEDDIEVVESNETQTEIETEERQTDEIEIFKMKLRLLELSK